MVAFGLLTLYAFYHLAKLFVDERKALIAAVFLSVDTIFFTHSSALLLDVPPLFFAILGFYLYFKERYLLCAASFGMAILSKEWSVLFVLALFVYHMIGKRPLSRTQPKITKPMVVKAAKFFAVLIPAVMIPLWAYAAAYQPPTETEVRITIVNIVDQSGNPVGNTTSTSTMHKGQVNNPIDQINYIMSYQSKLTLKNDNQTNFWNNYAWGWIIPYDIKPPVYYEKSVKTEIVTKSGEDIIKKEVIEKKPISWKGIGNMPIWLGIWLVAPFVSINIIKKRANKLDYLIIAWLVGTFLPWLFVRGIVHRIVYAFYFINVVPILALGIPYFIIGVSKGNFEKLIMFIWLATAIIFFIYYYPVNMFEFDS
jgi:4-amino-4-deoxy-L-arabinose transferase-like glycosyltransferase